MTRLVFAIIALLLITTVAANNRRLSKAHQGQSKGRKKEVTMPSMPSIKYIKKTLEALYPQGSALTDQDLSGVQLATQAFLWAFPLVVTAPNFVQNGFGASPSKMNKLLYQPTPINASVSSQITFPNINVLYSSAFLDLTQGPVQVSVPNTNGRYYVLQCMDMWGLTFGRIGFTETGTEAGTFTFVPPGYAGEINSTTLQPTTNGVWIVGRISVINQNNTDTAIVDSLLGEFKVGSLRDNPSIKVSTSSDEFSSDPSSSPIFQTTVEANTMFSSFLAAPKSNQADYWCEAVCGGCSTSIHVPILDPLVSEPSHSISTSVRAAYTAMVSLNQPMPSILTSLASFASLGITAQGVNWSKLSFIQKTELSNGALVGISWLQKNAPHASTSASDLTNTTSQLVTYTGWVTFPLIGSPDNSIENAAIVSLYYIGANIPAEAVYWQKTIDNCGNSFAIGKKYIFDLSARPPYNGFWSLTVYNKTGTNGLIETTNNTYSLGSQFPNMRINSKGGATLYLSQAPPPTKLQNNWLPLGVAETSGTEGFYLIFRIYSPTNANVIYDYAPPKIVVTDDNFVPIVCSGKNLTISYNNLFKGLW